jgi:DNA polymerase III subunit gamma/tau
MSYLAIARKWRPQRFDDIAGQTHITRTLQNAIRLQRIHHAFLFCGARGVGKTSGARILAKALQCENGPAENPCNECVACQEITRGSHPDVTEIDGASNNRVDDVRDLIETVRYMPTKGRYRIYVIDEVHMVTTAAFNALLKTLEEPPEHVVFIFATTDPQKLPETVVSRCQRFDFKMLPARTIQERLQQIVETEDVQIPAGVLSQIAREAGGSMRDGQSLLDQVLAFADGAITEAQAAEILGLVDRTLLLDLVGAMARCDVEQTLTTYARIAGFGVDTRSLADDVLTTLRHATVAAVIRQPERLIDLPAEEIQALQEIARQAGPESLQRRFDILARAADDIARSDSPELVLEMALAKMASIRPYAPVDALVDRLLELERRIGAGGPPGQARPRPQPRRPLPPMRDSQPAPQPPRPEPTPQKPAPRPEPAPLKPAPRPEPAPLKPAPRPEPPPLKPAPRPEPAPLKPAPRPEPAPQEADPTKTAPLASLDAAGWRTFVESLTGGRIGALRAVIAEGRFVAVDGDDVVLAFPREETREMASQRLADGELLEAVGRYFGRRLRLRAEALSDTSTPLSPGEQAREEASARRGEREQRARDNPAVQRAQAAWDDAEIVKIRHLKS